MEKFLKELNIEGLLEHDAFMVWDDFKIGSLVTLNKSQEGTIEVNFNNNGNVVTLGVLPKDECKTITKFADANWPIDQMFTCRICRKDETTGNYDQKIHVLIQIREIKKVNQLQIR